MKTINQLTQLPVIKPLFVVFLSCIAGKILFSWLTQLLSDTELPLTQVLFLTISLYLIWRYLLTALKNNYDEHRHFQCNCSVGDSWKDF